jgi:hypothetical protein
MDKVVIELTQQAKQNLLGFLNRVQLSGSEVPAYIELMQMIQQGIKKDGN